MTDPVEVMAKAICKSGRFETGQGTCAAICMSHLGAARTKCTYVETVHGKLARAALSALDAAGYAVVTKQQAEYGVGFEHAMRELPIGRRVGLIWLARWLTARVAAARAMPGYRAMIAAAQGGSDG